MLSFNNFEGSFRNWHEKSRFWVSVLISLRKTIPLGLLAILFSGVLMPAGLAHPPNENIRLAPKIQKGENSIRIGLEPVAAGLIAPNWGAPSPIHSGRMFVTDQPGILWAIELATGAKSVFLNVASRLVPLGLLGPGTSDERGLLGVAFHPDYAANGLLYTYTSEPADMIPPDFSTLIPGQGADHHSVVAEWQVPAPQEYASVVGTSTRRELLRIAQPQGNHNAGALNFGPDAMLYISLGDGGGADDQNEGHGAAGNGQNPGNVLGAILRIDPTGSNSVNGAYGIPIDNPFFPGGFPPFGGDVGCGDGLCDEIYAFGFRNPYRFSFDTGPDGVDHHLYVGDVGQHDIEEVDLIDRIENAGANYGWNIKEGSFCFDPNFDEEGFAYVADMGICPGDGGGLRDPIAEYDTHLEGHSVIGGFVYRGSAVPELVGRYVFGDVSKTFLNNGGRLIANRGRLFYLTETHDIVEFIGYGLSSLVLGFGRDAFGELYVLVNRTGVPFGNTGMVLKIVGK